MKNILKHINNQKGSNIIGYIIIITVTTIIAINLIPNFSSSAIKRNNIIINTFNSTDTIILD